jgi:hypothetical protein
MSSFLDAGIPPLSEVIATHLNRMNTRAFGDGQIAARVCMWVNKFHEETTVTCHTMSPASAAKALISALIKKGPDQRDDPTGNTSPNISDSAVSRRRKA